MILDALTRAEHERQLESQPDLKFVTPVKPQKNNPNKLWFWIGLAVLANALILYFVVGALSGSEEDKPAMAATDIEVVEPTRVDAPIVTQQQPIVVQDTQIQQATTVAQEATTQVAINNTLSGQTPQQNTITTNATPLAMEMSSEPIAEVDRPLLYEAKQASSKPKTPKPKPVLELAKTGKATSKGNVSFSSTELNADDAIPTINKPKLLIDKGYEENNVAQKPSSGVPNVKDLPEGTRSSLNQFEVNVHVFDDDPIRRFVLINMDKYKEGERIANNGPLVQEITPEGVVVDYGSGRALLPPR